jgi:hypothetical protein
MPSDVDKMRDEMCDKMRDIEEKRGCRHGQKEKRREDG